VDSQPVMMMLNSGTSTDVPCMRLLRAMASLAFEHGFDWVACHCTRTRNRLADQATRHRHPQDFFPYLSAEGFWIPATVATPSTCQTGSSRLLSGATFSLELGRRWRCHGSRRPSDGTPR
jgi:hypothetical protein